MYTTPTGYTESEAKVQARAERRAMLNQMALAEFWAAEQQRVNFCARMDAVENPVATYDPTLNTKRVMVTE